MKTGLVLEGGGLRGAYTAGALSWLLKEGIEFDYNVGISSGAQHLTSYLTKDIKYIKDIAVTIGAKEFKKGLIPLITEGNFVGYDHLFNYALKELAPLDLEKLKVSKVESEFGVFDLKEGKTVWINTKDIDKDYNILKAASIIPLAGKPVVIDGKKYVDAGAAYMIPIERSIEKKVEKHFVITTKPSSYVRKPTGFISNLYLAVFYRPYKVFRDLIKGRSNLYYKQRGIIDELVKAGIALEIFPSQAFNIGRFGGDLKELEQLFETGFNDCESRRDEIYAFLNLKVDDN